MAYLKNDNIGKLSNMDEMEKGQNIFMMICPFSEEKGIAFDPLNVKKESFVHSSSG